MCESTRVKPGHDSEERRLELPGFGELDFDPQFDLGQDCVQAGIAGGGFQVRGSIPEPQHGGLVEIAGQQFQLEIVEYVKRALAAREGALAPLGRVFLDALQRDQRIDAAKGAQRNGRVLRLWGVRLGGHEGTAGRAP